MAQRIKRARLEAGLSQRKLAEIVKGTEASIIRYEAGQARPRPARLKMMAEAVGKPVSYFLEDDFEPETGYRQEGVEALHIEEPVARYTLRLEDRISRLEEHLNAISESLDSLMGSFGKPAREKKAKALTGKPARKGKKPGRKKKAAVLKTASKKRGRPRKKA